MSYRPHQGFELSSAFVGHNSHHNSHHNSQHNSHHNSHHTSSHKHARARIQRTQHKHKKSDVLANIIISDEHPNDTTHIIPQKSDSNKDPGRSYVLNIAQINDNRYKYIQTTKKANLVSEQEDNSLLLECIETKTTLLQVIEFRGDNRKVIKHQISELDYVSLAQMNDHDLTVGEDHLVASYRFVVFGTNTENQDQSVTQRHKIVRRSLGAKGKKIYELEVRGMISVRLVTHGNLTYLTGYGCPEVFIGETKVEAKIKQDLVVALIDECGRVVWAKRSATTTNGDGLISDLTNAASTSVTTKNGSLNRKGDGLLMITGAYTGRITLNKTHDGTVRESLWWAEIDKKGCWTRSGVLKLVSKNGNNVTNGDSTSLPPTDQQIDHLRGYSIVAAGKPIHIAGTFKGKIDVPCDDDKDDDKDDDSDDVVAMETKPMYYLVGETPIPVEANISDLEYYPTPGVVMSRSGEVNFHTYFDTFITLGRVRNRNKGTIGLAILPIRTLLDVTNIATYVEHNNCNPTQGLVSDDTSYIGGNVYLSGNRVHGFASTF